MHIDREKPKYRQVKEYVIRKIETGEFATESQIPSIKDLSNLFLINKNTVVRALNELAAEKYIDQKHGVGSFVAPKTNSKKSYNIGILVHNIESPIYSKVIKNIDDNCRKHSYHIIPVSINGSFELEKKVISNFIQTGKIDGLIVFPVNNSDEEISYLEGVMNTGIPVIVFNSTGLPGNISSMSFEVYEGARLSVKHLHENGYQKIGFVSCNSQNHDVLQRLYGYRSGLEACSLAFKENYVFLVDTPEEQYGYNIADKIIDMSNRPDALVVISDEVAIGLMKRLFERNMSVPEDIAVIGGGDISIGSHPLYSLSTIAPDFADMGKQIFDILIEQIDHGISKTRYLCFKQKLIVRRSSSSKNSLSKDFANRFL